MMTARGASTATKVEDAWEKKEAADMKVQNRKDLKTINKELKKNPEKIKRCRVAVLGNLFQKRFCVIHNGIFYYFDKESDKKQKGAFTLKGKPFILNKV